MQGKFDCVGIKVSIDHEKNTDHLNFVYLFIFGAVWSLFGQFKIAFWTHLVFLYCF
jgi:hypothetical protein